MSTSTELLKNTLCTGATASVTTAAAAALCGAIENQNAIAPINAISHIAWGDKAARREKPSWKYTGVGLALNSAAVTAWAAVHEWMYGRGGNQRDVVDAVMGGAIVSGLAFATDYYVVPERFTPGFEKRLSNRSLLGIYTVLALSLALGSLAHSDSRN